MENEQKITKDSMLYWYPKIKDLKIFQPRTEIIPIKWTWDKTGNHIEISDRLFEKVKKQAQKFSFPVFIRGDQTSCKHDWKDTCFVEKLKDLRFHISNLIMGSINVDVFGGVPCDAIAIREFVPMQNLFTAFFGKMPVNPEIRFFVKDGKVKCWHWYWIEDAIFGASTKNWKKLIQIENQKISSEELLQMHADAHKVGKNFEGYWSIDFCKTKKGDWYLIDMATGERSWHPKECRQRNAV